MKYDREVEFRDPVWSPDGSKVLFVEADYTDVKQRWVLVPGDPSYPEVQQNRFARVGGEIEKLRIGVVNKDGEQLTWLPVECPAEGMYLGQVEWAGITFMPHRRMERKGISTALRWMLRRC